MLKNNSVGGIIMKNSSKDSALRKHLYMLVDKAESNGIILSKIPEYVDKMMKNNGAPEEKRRLVNHILTEYILSKEYKLWA